jgi:hypothetical protein
MRGPDFQEIREKLIDRLDSLVRELVPDGTRNGRYWIGKCPWRGDRRAGSFWILMAGQAKGAWKDEATGDTGDVVSLVQRARGLSDLKETRRECLRWLGIANGPIAPLNEEEQRRRAEENARRIEADARAEAERKRAGGDKALGAWLKAQKLEPARFVGSLLETYFLSRALDLASGLLARQKPLPGALRFFPARDYFCADGEILSLPCMPALMTGPDGKAQALHQTWLAPDGRGKAVLPDAHDNKPRKIWGAPNGAVIRIAKGAGNLTPEEAARQGRSGPLVVTEGIEDALAVHLALPDHRVWAAGTLGNLAHVPAHHPCVSAITVCADNDWDKPQATAALERAIAALKRAGKPVFVARSPRGKDMNDLLKGEAT